MKGGQGRRAQTTPGRGGLGSGVEAAGLRSVVGLENPHDTWVTVRRSPARLIRTLLAWAVAAAAVYIDSVAAGYALAAWVLPTIRLH